MTEQAIDGRQVARTALRIVGAYAAIASLWVLFSEPALESMFSEPTETVVAGVFEGWLFVAVTSLLLYRLVSRLLEQLVAAGRRERALHAEKLRALRLIETLAENSDDAIFAQDLRGRFLLFNRAASAYFGRAAQDVIGRDHHALFPPEPARALELAGRGVLERGAKVMTEQALPTAQGERRFRITMAPLHDDGGRVVGLFGVARELGAGGAAEVERLRRQVNDLSCRLGEAPPYAGRSLAAGDEVLRTD